jgi:putative glutamine amidotransferase
VVCGGTLYGDVQKEKKSRLKHVNFAHYDSYRHAVCLLPGTPLHKWYGRTELQVNSYHHQGVMDLAPRFKPMAHAKDGLVEAFYDPIADFIVGLQFHPERMPEEAERNLHIWKAFGSAIERRAL